MVKGLERKKANVLTGEDLISLLDLPYGDFPIEKTLNERKMRSLIYLSSFFSDRDIDIDEMMNLVKNGLLKSVGLNLIYDSYSFLDYVSENIETESLGFTTDTALSGYNVSIAVEEKVCLLGKNKSGVLDTTNFSSRLCRVYVMEIIDDSGISVGKKTLIFDVISNERYLDSKDNLGNALDGAAVCYGMLSILDYERFYCKDNVNELEFGGKVLNLVL